MIKSTLVVVLLAIFVATIQAANPFDTNNRPFVVGGSFKKVERKSPAASFACYNTTLGDWSEYKWADASVASATTRVQLNNGHVITLATLSSTKRGLVYWNLESSTVLTTAATVMESASASSTPVMFLSYDQKKLYIGGFFSRVGSTTYTLTQQANYMIFSFDISNLPTLAAPTEITSNYPTTASSLQGVAVWPVSNNNQILFIFSPAKIGIYDPTSTSWKEITPTTSLKSGVNFKLSSSTGELYAKSVDTTTSPYATTFLKYDPAAADSFSVVKTLAASSFVTQLNAANYVKVWTVGGNAIYYAVSFATSFTNFGDNVQNIQKIALTPSATDPVALAKTRLTTTNIRSTFDIQPIADIIDTMYYDENTKQLIVNMNSDDVYQVYGTRDTDSAKQNYELNYRFQPMGKIVAYDATADAFVTPYGGSFDGPVVPMITSATAKVSCFFGIGNYYRTWSPNFAVYDQGKDMFVAENLLSGQIDYEWMFGSAPYVKSVENSDDSGIVYVGGSFRTISGTVYNSIVARTKTGLVALGTGLRKHNFDYNYFDLTAGSVKKLIRSKDNKYLFVLGDFNRAGDLWVNGLAYWNIEKKTWNKLETNAISGTVNDIDYDGRYLYAVGTFTQAGKYVVKNAARFDMESQTWLPMNAGLDAGATAGVVVDGKFVALAVGSGSGVNSVNNIAVWSSNSWKAIQMDSTSNSGCNMKEVCTDAIPYTAATYFKGRIYFISNNKIYVSDTSMSKGTLYLDGAVTSTLNGATQFFNYPKTNTIAVATLGGAEFVEYNVDTKNVQHTVTRDKNTLVDGSIMVLSNAPKNVFAAVAMIVALIVTLFF